MHLSLPPDVKPNWLWKATCIIAATCVFFIVFYLKLQYPNDVHYSISDLVSSQDAVRLENQDSKGKVKMVFPGTKWCGIGSTATDYRDLGKNKYVDECCRKHDSCPLYILPGETKFGLKNEDVVVKSLCGCDDELYRCFKSSGNFPAYAMGYMYFTLWNMKCFERRQQVVGCKRYDRGRCVEYMFDKNSTEVYQWFDNPKF